LEPHFIFRLSFQNRQDPVVPEIPSSEVPQVAANSRFQLVIDHQKETTSVLLTLVTMLMSAIVLYKKLFKAASNKKKEPLVKDEVGNGEKTVIPNNEEEDEEDEDEDEDDNEDDNGSVESTDDQGSERLSD
jgi:hypothetical protein